MNAGQLASSRAYTSTPDTPESEPPPPSYEEATAGSAIARSVRAQMHTYMLESNATLSAGLSEDARYMSQKDKRDLLTYVIKEFTVNACNLLNYEDIFSDKIQETADKHTAIENLGKFSARWDVAHNDNSSRLQLLFVSLEKVMTRQTCNFSEAATEQPEKLQWVLDGLLEVGIIQLGEIDSTKYGATSAKMASRLLDLMQCRSSKEKEKFVFLMFQIGMFKS